MTLSARTQIELQSGAEIEIWGILYEVWDCYCWAFFQFVEVKTWDY